jgi:hypothetical protein
MSAWTLDRADALTHPASSLRQFSWQCLPVMPLAMVMPVVSQLTLECLSKH